MLARRPPRTSRHVLRYCSGALDLRQTLRREDQVDLLKNEEEFDLLIIGGGCIGTGAALDAATRGLKVACVERADFGSGSSGRSSKIFHGGLRHLERAIFRRDSRELDHRHEALRERSILASAAPHLVKWVPFMLPCYNWQTALYTWLGVKLHGLSELFTSSRPTDYFIGKERALDLFPMLEEYELVGATIYHDCLFDDARYNITLAMTAAAHGGVVANYVEVTALDVQNGKVAGAHVKDHETGETFSIKAKAVINAAGPFCDDIRRMTTAKAEPTVTHFAGTHVVLPKFYAPEGMGMIDPSAAINGKLTFFLPWKESTLAGVIEMETERTSYRPVPEEGRVRELLDDIDAYLTDELDVRRADVKSAWSGLWSVANDDSRNKGKHPSESSMYKVNTEATGLITISGGKWLTYRAIAEKAVNRALHVAGLAPRRCVTRSTKLLGAEDWSHSLHVPLIQMYNIDDVAAQHLSQTYGDQAFDVAHLASTLNPANVDNKAGSRLVEGFPYLQSEVYYATREYARTAVDIIARRTRLAYQNKAMAEAAYPLVVDLMAESLGWDADRKVLELQKCADFLATISGPQAEALSEPKARAKFQRFAHNGFVNGGSLYQLAASMGMNLSEKELNELLARNSIKDTFTPAVSEDMFIDWWSKRQETPAP